MHITQKINGECVLGGLISKGCVAQLPSTCRPENALMFNVNNHQCTMRLDIYTDGKIKAITGGCHAWVSLSGVSFIRRIQSCSVPRVRKFSYTLVDGECLVQGFIHGGSCHISTLPVECRPYKRLIFNLNNHQYTSRVDVLPDGASVLGWWWKISWLAFAHWNQFRCCSNECCHSCSAMAAIWV